MAPPEVSGRRGDGCSAAYPSRSADLSPAVPPGGGTFACLRPYRFYFDPGQDGYGRVTVNIDSKVDFIQ
jgi:hypothetical protein